MDDLVKSGYVSEEVFNLINTIKEGEAFLEAYCKKFLKDGNSKLDLIGDLCEAKTYFNLELNKQFPKLDDNNNSYKNFQQYLYITTDYIGMIDNQIKMINATN